MDNILILPLQVLTFKMKKLLLFLVVSMAAAFSVGAQEIPDEQDAPFTEESLEYRARFSIGQNFADYILLGTLNLDGQISFWRNWSVMLGARYNNWTWRPATALQFEKRQRTFYAGVRWWPWYSYSGWFVGGKFQYQEYNRGGIFTRKTEEGDALGVSIGGGYDIHIFSWLNLEFAGYLWAGGTKYVTYACPYCGKRIDEGKKFFVLPDEVRISLQFIF